MRIDPQAAKSGNSRFESAERWAARHWTARLRLPLAQPPVQHGPGCAVDMQSTAPRASSRLAGTAPSAPRACSRQSSTAPAAPRPGSLPTAGSAQPRLRQEHAAARDPKLKLCKQHAVASLAQPRLRACRTAQAVQRACSRQDSSSCAIGCPRACSRPRCSLGYQARRRSTCMVLRRSVLWCSLGARSAAEGAASAFLSCIASGWVQSRAVHS